jgi:hypothetical protein
VETRRVPFKAGNEAWIVRTAGDNLGTDLWHNQAVLVVRIDGHWAFIRDGAGRDRRIPISSLDPGCEYQGRSGHWYPEDHPLVHRTLERLIERLESEGNTKEVERLRGILNRHPDVE